MAEIAPSGEENQDPVPMPVCFVIMPISTPERYVDRYPDGDRHFVNIYEHLFKPAIVSAGMRAVPPKFDGGGVIHSQIISQLSDADLVLCDMSIFNPNVFFELGVRTALNRPVAMVRDSFMKPSEIPFDQVPVSIPEYSGLLAFHEVDEQRALICDHIKACLTGGAQNEMWKVFGLQTSATRNIQPGDGTAEDKLDLLIRLAQRDGQTVRASEIVRGSEIERSNALSRAIGQHLEGATAWFRDDDGSYEISVHYVPEAAVLAEFQTVMAQNGMVAYLRAPDSNLKVDIAGVKSVPPYESNRSPGFMGEEPF